VVKAFHPEVDDPVQEDTDVVALMVEGLSVEHGRTKILSGVIKRPKTLTQIKSTLTAGDPPITPPRHGRTDVSFFFHLLSNIHS
jgi:hypothetical protein